MRFVSFLIYFYIFLLSFSFSNNVTTTNKEQFLSVRDVLKLFYERYQNFINYSVEFDETNGRAKTKGKIVFQKPNNYYVLWSKDGERKDIELYLNNGIMSIFLKRINVVLEENLKLVKKEKVFNRLNLNLLDINVLMNNYNFEFKEKKITENKLYHLYLTPKNSEDMLDDMEIWIDRRGDLKKSITYIDDEILIYNFFNVKVNQELPVDFFKFDPPPYVEKIINKILKYD